MMQISSRDLAVLKPTWMLCRTMLQVFIVIHQVPLSLSLLYSTHLTPALFPAPPSTSSSQLLETAKLRDVRHLLFVTRTTSHTSNTQRIKDNSLKCAIDFQAEFLQSADVKCFLFNGYSGRDGNG